MEGRQSRGGAHTHVNIAQVTNRTAADIIPRSWMDTLKNIPKIFFANLTERLAHVAVWFAPAVTVSEAGAPALFVSLKCAGTTTPWTATLTK